MKSLVFLVCVFASSALAQEAAVFPNNVATMQDLLVASNLFSTSLTTGISATSTTIPVVTTAGLALPAEITIGQEIIEVCSTSGSAFVICDGGRGFDGSYAVPAPAQSRVAALITAWHHNQLALEIIAIETYLKALVPPSTLSWSTLTSDTWGSLTSALWSALNP